MRQLSEIVCRPSPLPICGILGLTRRTQAEGGNSPKQTTPRNLQARRGPCVGQYMTINVQACHYMFRDALWLVTDPEAAHAREQMRRMSWSAAIARMADDAWCKAAADSDRGIPTGSSGSGRQ